MNKDTGLPKIAMHIERGCLIVPVQAELYDKLVLQIQRDILSKIGEKGVKGVIIDVSAVAIMDSFVILALSDTAKMASLLGAHMVLVGLRPGVIISLVYDLGIQFKNVDTVATLEEAYKKLEPFVDVRKEAEEAEEIEEEAIETPEEDEAEKGEEILDVEEYE